LLNNFNITCFLIFLFTCVMFLLSSQRYVCFWMFLILNSVVATVCCNLRGSFYTIYTWRWPHVAETCRKYILKHGLSNVISYYSITIAKLYYMYTSRDSNLVVSQNLDRVSPFMDSCSEKEWYCRAYGDYIRRGVGLTTGFIKHSYLQHMVTLQFPVTHTHWSSVTGLSSQLVELQLLLEGRSTGKHTGHTPYDKPQNSSMIAMFISSNYSLHWTLNLE
jgi:hypothetical protein